MVDGTRPTPSGSPHAFHLTSDRPMPSTDLPCRPERFGAAASLAAALDQSAESNDGDNVYRHAAAMDRSQRDRLRLYLVVGDEDFLFPRHPPFMTHLKELGITGVRPKGKRPLFVNDIVNLINFRNDEVSGSVCVRNPDRTSQFLLVPRDVAEKILVLGMP